MYMRSAVSGQLIRVQIRSVRGETMDVEVPRDCTVGQLRDFLIGYYGYPPATSLVYGRYVVGDERLVEEFPFGSLVLVTPSDAAYRGHPAQQQPLLDPHRTQQQQQQRAPPQHRRQHQYSQQPQDQQPRGQRGPDARARQQQYASHHAENHQKQQPLQFQGQGNPQQPQREPSNPFFPVGDQQQQQQQLQERLGLDPREAGNEATRPVSRSLHSRTHSNSMASSGTRTPRKAADNKQIDRPCESLKSVSCRSSPPPQLNSYGTVLSEKTSPSKFVGNSIPSAAPGQSMDGKESRSRTPQANSQGTPSTTASRSPRDANVEVARGASEDAGDTASVAPRISLKCMAPALRKSINLELPGDATLGDLLLEVVSQEPRLAGSKVVFRGKLLSGSDAKLNACGIHADAASPSLSLTNPDASGMYTLFFASGEYSEPQKVMLLEIEADTACIEALIKGGELTVQQRRGYYEELMRILFRTDNLQELEGEWRSKRKDAVMRATQLQDMLNVEVSS